MHLSLSHPGAHLNRSKVHLNQKRTALIVSDFVNMIKYEVSMITLPIQKEIVALTRIAWKFAR